MQVEKAGWDSPGQASRDGRARRYAGTVRDAKPLQLSPTSGKASSLPQIEFPNGGDTVST